jgi:hypothetical protein
MAAQVARRHLANNSDSITQARHTEIARRYAWQARQRRKRHEDKPDPARLLTLIRMRELERLFARRYGRLLPDDAAGRDDLIVAAHHIAFLRGDVIKHIVGWARAWAPWMPSAVAERLAERVAAEPRKWTADALAWRLRLSMAERTELKITTIGAFDMSKAEREVERKRKRREAERARRAKRSTKRPRGRPKKCVASREEPIAGHGFSPDRGGSAREAPDTGLDVNASTQKTRNTSRAASCFLDLVEGQTPLPPWPNPRAAPPPQVIAEAIKVARTYRPRDNRDTQWIDGNLVRHYVGELEARTLIYRLWPRHIERVHRRNSERERAFTFGKWQSDFKAELDREYAAKRRFRGRRHKWERDRERAKWQKQRELEITGGRAPRPVKIKPPRRIKPPRSKLAPDYRYLTVENLARLDAQEAQRQRIAALNERIYARRRERALRGTDLAAVVPEDVVLAGACRSKELGSA